LKQKMAVFLGWGINKKGFNNRSIQDRTEAKNRRHTLGGDRTLLSIYNLHIIQAIKMGDRRDTGGLLLASTFQPKLNKYHTYLADLHLNLHRLMRKFPLCLSVSGPNSTRFEIIGQRDTKSCQWPRKGEEE
jgi:hypothetical protein